MTYLLALDQGTTSSRAIAFDAQGRIAALAQREFTQHFPSPGQVEHDADEIWQTQLAVARECVQKLGSADADMAAIAPNIAAIGITNQRETTVLWSRETGRPVAPAIVWQDRRTTARCEALSPAERQLIQSRTGLVPDAYFSATKLQWLLDNVPGARRRAEAGELAFGTVDSWLAWNLTGGAKGGGLHVTDASNASRTMLMNLHTLQWDDELLALFGIPRAVLPRIVPSSGEIGATAPDLLGAPIRIAGIAGDQQAATFGHGCLAPGMAKNTYGTGCFMLMNTGGQPAATTCWAPSAGSRLIRRTIQQASPAPPTAWKAASSWPAPPCNGCATACKSSAPPPKWKSWPPACPTRATSFSCPPSPAWARPTGTAARAARSSA